MNIGKLRDRVEIQSKQKTQNEFGEEAISYITVLTAWARVLTKSAREIFNSGLNNEIDYKVLLRHNEQIVPEMVVVWNGKTLEIVSVLDADEKRKFMFLICKEIR